MPPPFRADVFWMFFSISKLLPRKSWVFFVQALFIRAVFPSSKGNNSSFFSCFGSHKNSDFFVREIRFPRNSRYPFPGEVRCSFFRWMGFFVFQRGKSLGLEHKEIDGPWRNWGMFWYDNHLMWYIWVQSSPSHKSGESFNLRLFLGEYRVLHKNNELILFHVNSL